MKVGISWHQDMGLVELSVPDGSLNLLQEVPIDAEVRQGEGQQLIAQHPVAQVLGGTRVVVLGCPGYVAGKKQLKSLCNAFLVEYL